MSAAFGGVPGHTAWVCESCGSSFLRQGGPGNFAGGGTRILPWLIGIILIAAIAFGVWWFWIR